MSNVSVIRGALIRDTLSSCKFNEKVKAFIAVASDATDIFIGDLVKTTGVFDSTGRPIVTQAAAGDKSVGVVVGFNLDNISFTRHRAASTEREVFVECDPMLEFEIQANGLITTADAGKRANIVVGAGNAQTGLSGMQLDVATLSAQTGQLKIVSVAKVQNNAIGTNTKLICLIADHEYNFYPTGENFWDYNTGTNTLTTIPANANVDIGGKLGVAGLIDPTGLILDPQAVSPSTANALLYYDSVISAFKCKENNVMVTMRDHNTLINLQAAASGVTNGHINAASQTIAGTKTFSSNAKCSVAAPLAIDDLTRRDYVDASHPGTANGFPNRTDSQFVYTPATQTVRLEVVPPGASFDYYLAGVKYTRSAAAPLEIVHANVKGIYYIYINASNTLTASTTAPDARTVVHMNEVTYDPTPDSGIPEGFVVDKRYWVGTSALDKEKQTAPGEGAYVLSGLVIGNYQVAPAVPADAHNAFSLSSGIVKDLDILTTLDALPAAGAYHPFYRFGVSSFRLGLAATVPFLISIDWIALNILSGGAWILTPTPDSYYVNYYCVAIPTYPGSSVYRIGLTPGQRAYPTLAEAQAESFSNLNLSVFPVATFAPLYQITFQANAAWASLGHCRIAATPVRLTGLSGMDAMSPLYNDIALKHVIEIGDQSVNGSWRILPIGTNLKIQVLVAGVWTEAGTYATPP